MSLLDKILGRHLATSERGKESLSVWTGVPVLGLDALASTGYGPEAALAILVPLGLVGLQYFPIIAGHNPDRAYYPLSVISADHRRLSGRRWRLHCRQR